MNKAVSMEVNPVARSVERAIWNIDFQALTINKFRDDGPVVPVVSFDELPSLNASGLAPDGSLLAFDNKEADGMLRLYEYSADGVSVDLLRTIDPATEMNGNDNDKLVYGDYWLVNGQMLVGFTNGESFWVDPFGTAINPAGIMLPNEGTGNTLDLAFSGDNRLFISRGYELYRNDFGFINLIGTHTPSQPEFRQIGGMTVIGDRAYSGYMPNKTDLVIFSFDINTGVDTEEGVIALPDVGANTHIEFSDIA